MADEWAEFRVQAPQAQAGADPWAEFRQKSKVDVTEDIVKTVPAAAVRGLAGGFGLIGDMRETAGKGAEAIAPWLKEKTGIEINADTGRRVLGSLPAIGPAVQFAPTTQQVTKAVEPLTGELYKPQTTAGKYVNTPVEFATNPASYIGPGGVGMKFVSALMGGLGSEAAGQATEGTKYEPLARMGGAVAGGLAPTVGKSGAVVPAREAIKDAATGAYTKARGLGVEIKPASVESLADDITASLQKSGYRESNVPGTFNAVAELKNRIGSNHTLDDIDAARQVLGRAAANPTEKDAARRAIEQIDNYLENIGTNPNVVAGNAKEAGALLKEARGNYAAAKRAETVAGADFRAELNASSAGSGANIDNTTRQAVKSILLNPKKQRGFSPEEIEQMATVVGGTKLGNIARFIGKAAPTGNVSGALSAGTGFMVGGPAGAVGLPLAGYAAKKIGDMSTARQARKLDEMVRARSPLAEQTPQNMNPQAIALIRALMASAQQ